LSAQIVQKRRLGIVGQKIDTNTGASQRKVARAFLSSQRFRVFEGLVDRRAL
jgi:hypothetical protein